MTRKAAKFDADSDEVLALGRQLCFAVYSAAHAFNRAYKPLLDRFGLTYPQYLVLLTLWQQDRMTVKRIGEELGLDSGTLSPLLKRLEAGGYVRRVRDAADERQVIVSLTDGGRELKAEAFGILRDIGNASGCSLEEVGELRDALHRLTQRLAGSRHES
ncbi:MULTISPECIES: MarR family winged helix-turn-helix transcriptional regulator [unclassified Sinorhizobium]|jgi:MarR family transcriptional regulator, organic hydroperoxide resistance regulator|uniref:MarR family winged helix-turn-helix transcriptional regulator n=1 Tax=unclassified Sinorhizobium TaxID=2613772 RepID=UPI0023D7E363|nr:MULTISPECIES: MarR family transcriptional regulator [unclassified Sinorhizobium]WEJ10919.1 MarR family transcriptional regulator [Sinorhizobium sp. M103]WEJ14494.1 MarR family transcriptional regulator [Sinorhizobium sp. K101]WEJ37901.1 MarR family transcriptional regulator [Sinorhizobium sp. C101]GCA48897.1 organic hydroperoxide resistance transcriptional regulator [Sinorhizobium sp. KGO-5]